MAAILDACDCKTVQVDLMLAGASDRTMDLPFAKFSAIGALSQAIQLHLMPSKWLCNGRGAGALVLKRLGDAIADGDTIHAVIRGLAAHPMAVVKESAPSQRGQIQAIARAYQQAGHDQPLIG